MRRLPSIAFLTVVTVGSLGACTDPEPEQSEFVASCLNAVPEATAEMCTCAEETGREAMSEDGYAMFLISFLPDRDARANAVMAREGFEVDIERFTLAMLDVMEGCGFGAVSATGQ